MQKVGLRNTVYNKLPFEISKKAKGLENNLIHFHFIDKKCEVLGGSFSKSPGSARDQDSIFLATVLKFLPSCLISFL